MMAVLRIRCMATSKKLEGDVEENWNTCTSYTSLIFEMWVYMYDWEYELTNKDVMLARYKLPGLKVYCIPFDFQLWTWGFTVFSVFPNGIFTDFSPLWPWLKTCSTQRLVLIRYVRNKKVCYWLPPAQRGCLSNQISKQYLIVYKNNT